jgi:hypothetical protein
MLNIFVLLIEIITSSATSRKNARLISFFINLNIFFYFCLALKDLSVTLDPIDTNSLTVNSSSMNTNNSHSRKSSSSTAAAASSGVGAASLKKAKWHLGIRSQSKPQDIMNEVFKAMKDLSMVSIFLFFLFNYFNYFHIGMEILQ